MQLVIKQIVSHRVAQLGINRIDSNRFGGELERESMVGVLSSMIAITICLFYLLYADQIRPEKIATHAFAKSQIQLTCWLLVGEIKICMNQTKTNSINRLDPIKF